MKMKKENIRKINSKRKKNLFTSKKKSNIPKYAFIAILSICIYIIFIKYIFSTYFRNKIYKIYKLF